MQRAASVPFGLATVSRLTLAIDPGELSVMLLAKEMNATAVIDEVAARP